MTIKFNNFGNSGGATLHYNGKVVSKVHYDGVLVYQNGLAKGTLLYEGNPPASFSSKLIKSDLSNIKGIRVYLNKKFKYSYRDDYYVEAGNELQAYIDVSTSELNRGYLLSPNILNRYLFLPDGSSYISTTNRTNGQIYYENGEFHYTPFFFAYASNTFTLMINHIESL